VEKFVSIYFEGSWPASVAAAVLLLTKARRFGIHLNVSIVQDQRPCKTVAPALFYSPLLVGLGLPHATNDPSMVMLPGKSDSAGLVYLKERWLRIDRSGFGEREESKAMLSILQSQDKADWSLQQKFFAGCQQLGITLEPALLDLFFALDDLDDRLDVLLRIGRCIKGSTGKSLQELLGPIDNREILIHKTFQPWYARCPNALLSEQIRKIETELLHFNLQMLSSVSTPSMLGLQRSLVDFLGAISARVDPLSYLQKQYQFLGGKFVKTRPSGKRISFPKVQIPNTDIEMLDWLIDETKKGEAAVEDIWRSLSEPEQ